MKKCIKCQRELPLDQFYSDRQKKDGKTPYCRDCRRGKAREQYLKNPDKAKARAKARRDGGRLEYDLARMGMSQDRYLEVLSEQDGKCAVCKEDETLVLAGTGRIRRLSVDHDHNCCPQKRDICGNCNRGLLCNRCNRMLGMVGDDIELLRQAIKYLERYKSD